MFEIFHASRFLINKFKWTAGITNASLPIELKEYLIKRIAQLKEQKLDVILTGNSENVAHWGFINGAKGLVNVDEMLGRIPKIDSTTVFLLVIKEDEDRQTYDHFLIQSKSRIDSTIGQFTVYSYQLQRSE